MSMINMPVINMTSASSQVIGLSDLKLILGTLSDLPLDLGPTIKDQPDAHFFVMWLDKGAFDRTLGRFFILYEVIDGIPGAFRPIESGHAGDLVKTPDFWFFVGFCEKIGPYRFYVRNPNLAKLPEQESELPAEEISNKQ